MLPAATLVSFARALGSSWQDSASQTNRFSGGPDRVRPVHRPRTLRRHRRAVCVKPPYLAHPDSALRPACRAAPPCAPSRTHTPTRQRGATLTIETGAVLLLGIKAFQRAAAEIGEASSEEISAYIEGRFGIEITPQYIPLFQATLLFRKTNPGQERSKETSCLSGVK